MLASRWRVAGLVLAGALLGLGVFVVGQEPLVDLRVSQIALDPGTSVASGETITASVVVERSGPPLDRDAEVQITWRRRDREEPCGTSAGVFLAGDGPTAQTFVTTLSTSDLAPGAYEVIALVDPGNALAEANEANNRLAASLEILPPLPELHPVRAEVAPTPPLLWGESATVSVGVANTGRAMAGPFHVTLAMFPVYCVNETTGDQWRVSLSEAKNAKGFYEFRFMPDPTGSAAPQVVGLASLTAALPDDSWIVFAEEQAPGLEQDRMTQVRAVFSTGLSLRTLLTTPGVQSGAIGSSAVAVLSQGDADRLELCTTTYAIRIVVEDAYGATDEDPLNNTLAMALSVRSSFLELPDLVPIAVSFDRPMPLNWDDDVNVDVVIANRGGGVAPLDGGADIGVSFFYRRAGATSWLPLAAETIPSLGIDENTSTDSVEVTIDASRSDLKLVPGSYELWIVVDEARAIAEQDEWNNEIVVGFSVQGTELHPVGLEVSSASIQQGDSVDIIATIENTGDRSLEEFSVGFFLGETRFDTFTYRATSDADPGLEEEDRTRTQGTLHTEDLAPGKHTLRVAVDPDNRIPELDETNNEIRTTVSVLPPAERLAELYVSEVILSPGSPILAGEPVVARARVGNGGTMDAGRFSVAFLVVRDDGTPWSAGLVDCSAQSIYVEGAQACACQTTTGLGRGSAQTLEYSFWTDGWPEGRYALHVWVDPPTPDAAGGEVREQDEGNNEMIFAFSLGRPAPGQVSPGANLVADGVHLQPASAAAGAPSTVLLATVANRGTIPTGAFTVDVRWVRADGATLVLNSSTVNGLNASQSVALRQELELGSIGSMCGNHTFEVVVDPSNRLAEADETDNVASAIYNVDCGGTPSYGPDLTVSLSVPNARDGALTVGCPATAELVVTNRGILPAGPFRTELRQAGTVIGGQDVVALSAQASTTVHIDLRTSTAGTPRLTAVVDVAGAVEEQNEENNEAEVTVAIAPREASAVTRIGGPYGGAVGFLVLDAASGLLVAASDGGALHVFSRSTPAAPRYDVSLDDSAAITGLELDRGTAVRTAYVTTASGVLHRIALSTGTRVGAAVRVGTTATALALDVAGTAYVGTDTGIAVVGRSSVIATSIPLGARVLDLAVDASGTTIYALSGSTLYAISTSSQTVVCSASAFGGEATALGLGPAAIYVGTSAGRVLAYSPCTSYGALGAAMLRSWKVDLSSAGAAVTSLAVYPETAADPVYVALCGGGAGRIAALTLAGQMLWSTSGTSFSCAPANLAVDRTRGRVTFSDAGGTIRVLGDRGDALVVENALAGLGKSIRSEIVTDSYVSESDGVSRFAELFYAGTSDGNLYVVESVRGGCP